MVNIQKGGLGLLINLGKAWLRSEWDKTTPEEETATSTESYVEPKILFWESSKFELDEKSEPYLDAYVDDVGLDIIPNATDETIAEYKYNFDDLSRLYLPEVVRNFNVTGKVKVFLSFVNFNL